MKKPPFFPKDFLWGASTAAHQVEGNTHNQWTVWELENAQELARTAERRLGWLSNWDDIRGQAENPENYVSGRGVEHFTRYDHDFDIMRQLHFNAFRFSIEWSRLQPAPGEWDDEAIEHYRRYIRALRERGIEPFLTLWHWTMPVWFAKLGGFEHAGNLHYWDEFVRRITNEYADELNYVITINEPNVYASMGYFSGEWPPEVQSKWRFLRVYWNLVRAHKRAYRILKDHKPALHVGAAQQLANIQAKRSHHSFDVFVTRWMRYFWNWWFVNRIRDYQDFVGVNYYFTDYYQGLRRANPTFPVSDLGWYLEPEGLYPILLRIWQHYRTPIIVTESGLADANDEYRHWWIEQSIMAMQRAMSEGVQVHGYLHWSLLDNFEWAYGWWPQFGLVQVDRRTMKRTVRPSAEWYREQIEQLRGE